MANYFTLQSSGGSALKVKVLAEAFELATVPLQNYERTIDGNASLNVNADRASFKTMTGMFKVSQTVPSGYISYAQLEAMMTSNVAVTRDITVVDDLGVSRSMIFVGDFRPISLVGVRNASTNTWIVPFELHEQ